MNKYILQSIYYVSHNTFNDMSIILVTKVFQNKSASNRSSTRLGLPNKLKMKLIQNYDCNYSKTIMQMKEISISAWLYQEEEYIIFDTKKVLKLVLV